MAETRAVRGNEGRGIAIAVAAHVVIIGLLSVQWTAGDRRFDNPPMEVDLIAETAPTSTAPVITDTPPAPRLGEEDESDIAAPEPVPAPPLPEPVVRPTPAPTPRQVERPKPAPTKKPPASKEAPPKKVQKKPPTKKAPPRSAGQSSGDLDRIGRELTKSNQNKGAPAAVVGPQTQSAIRASINAKVRPYWNKCAVSGVDVNELVTKIEFKLTRAGKLAGFTSVTTTGQNDSNKPQVAR
ncbi:MAG: hypothetical protein ACREB0_11610, partial [Sphingopyxis sp.]